MTQPVEVEERASAAIEIVSVPMVTKEELLIENVKKLPILYDPSHREYKNVKLRNDKWAQVALDSGFENGDEAKDKWRNLKDGYKQARKRWEKWSSGQRAKPFKPWKYMSEMEFLKDIVVDNTPTDTNFAMSTQPQPSTSSNTTATAPPRQIINSDDESSETGEDEESITNKDTPNSRKRSATELDNAIVDLIVDHKKKRKNRDKEECDPLKLYFMAYYGTVKKMKVQNQLKVKRALNDILLNMEEAEAEVADNF